MRSQRCRQLPLLQVLLHTLSKLLQSSTKHRTQLGEPHGAAAAVAAAAAAAEHVLNHLLLYDRAVIRQELQEVVYHLNNAIAELVEGF
jgi:hypothetical protein